MALRISKADCLAGSKLLVTFSHGETLELDLAPMIRMGGVFSKLAETSYCSQVRISEHGLYLSWPEELDISAESIYRRAANRGVQTFANGKVQSGSMPEDHICLFTNLFSSYYVVTDPVDMKGEPLPLYAFWKDEGEYGRGYYYCRADQLPEPYKVEAEAAEKFIGDLRDIPARLWDEKFVSRFSDLLHNDAVWRGIVADTSAKLFGEMFMPCELWNSRRLVDLRGLLDALFSGADYHLPGLRLIPRDEIAAKQGAQKISLSLDIPVASPRIA